MDPVERQVTLPADPDEVWALLTDPHDLEGWLGENVQLDPSPGSRGRVREHDGTVRHLVVEEVDEGRHLSWTWWPDHDDPDGSSRVAITLTPTEGGTVVHVVEQPLTATATSARASLGERWSHRLLHFEALLLLAAAVRG